MKSSHVVAVSVHSSNLADALWNMSACTVKIGELSSDVPGLSQLHLQHKNTAHVAVQATCSLHGRTSQVAEDHTRTAPVSA